MAGQCRRDPLTFEAPHRSFADAVASPIAPKRVAYTADFGGKVPVYPGYVCAVVATLTTGRPIKWIEDRSENLQADSFARDYHIHAELAADKTGKMQALRISTIADHGAADAAANPSKFPAGLFSICTGSYDLPTAHVEVDGVYTNKAPGGVAYACSFRIAEAVYLVTKFGTVVRLRPAGGCP